MLAASRFVGSLGHPYIEFVSPNRLANNAYLIPSISMVLFFVPVILTLPALNDLFIHAATLERLQEDFWNPRDPMVDEPGLGNPYFSPYMVFWACVAKLSGMNTFVVLRLAGVFNLLLFLVGLGLFVRTLSPRRLAPLFSLAAVLFLWGVMSREIGDSSASGQW